MTKRLNSKRTDGTDENSGVRLLILGTGRVGKEVMRQAIGSRLITATTRNPDRSQELIELGVEPLVLEKDSVEQVSHVANGSDVLV